MTDKHSHSISRRKIFDIGTVITLITIILGGVYWAGDINGRLSLIEPQKINERISKIQNKVETADKSRVDDLPVGSIVQSILPLAIFSSSVGEQGEFNPKTSKWAPCDNRSIVGSALAGKGIAETPDIRGVFIRGLNSFASDELQALVPNHSDPNKFRIAGSYQPDGVGSHTHVVRTQSDWKSKNDPNQNYLATSEGNNPFPALPFWTEEPWEKTGETRPKNIALYFYIKIN